MTKTKKNVAGPIDEIVKPKAKSKVSKPQVNDDSEIKPPKTVDPRNALNDLTSTEWLPETISVWNQRGLGANHPDAQIERQHPAPFSFTDVSRLVRFFTKKGETVLDPFAGVGSTLKACAIEGRKGIGFELNPKYVALTKKRLALEVPGEPGVIEEQDVKVGDARLLIKKLDENSLDLIVTSPPYWNILHKVDHKAKQERVEQELDTKYSDDKRDLGNIEKYDDFLEELAKILRAAGKALKPKKHMVVIVSDFRDKSRFVMFHADIANALSKYQLELRGITVLYQRHKRIFPYGYPYAYVPNIHHQYLVILQNVKKS